ncbi:MAG TPA: ABC transporter permease, partial [Polyangiaceae bacterium]|nr:ABC transporter permease [Polyangiaceae bacterium]
MAANSAHPSALRSWIRLRSSRSALAMAWGAAESLVLLWVLASLVFLALRTLPGDPAALILGDQATASELAALRGRLGFDRPLYVQYAHFLRGFFTLDFGDSLRRPGVHAGARVLEALGPTGELAGLAVAMGSILGIAGAVLAVGPWLGARRRFVDRVFVVLASTPLLAFAPLLTYVFAVRWRVLPLPGDPQAGFLGLLFASALLAIPLSAHVGRIGRAALEEVRGAPFLTVVRAKGGSFARAWCLHGLPATSGPIVTTIGTQLGALLGGAVVLERLFERPGLGTLILESYASRDLPVLEASVVAAGALFVATQAIAGA